MDRRTFIKVLALAPAAVGGVAVTSPPDPVHQAYPVMYGPPISCFNAQVLLGIRPATHESKQR